MTEPPLCECHGKSMRWGKDRKGPLEGYWRCKVVDRDKKNERQRRYRRNHPELREKDRLRAALYRDKNPEKISLLNSQRIFVGDMYVGRISFSEAEKKEMLDGAFE